MTVRPVVSAEITDLASAQAWVEGIFRAGLSFHFEDAGDTIINARTGERTFSDDEVPILRDRVAALYTFDWGKHQCPIGYLLHIEETVA